MKDFFKPEDFNGLFDEASKIISTKKANKKLNALIESWPLVKGFKCNDHGFLFGEKTVGDDSHIIYRARLAFVEEIVKEPCTHKPVCTFVSATEKSEKGLVPTKFICDLCGVELQATWSEKK